MSTFFDRIEASNEYKTFLSETEEQIDTLERSLNEIKERLEKL